MAARFRTLAAAALLVFVSVGSALAVNPDEVLDDPALEQRARTLSAQLRCLVCQNQSIDDSNADLAKDLRLLVRERIVRGDSDEAVIDYVVSRYGEFVLLKPRFAFQTLLLWATPVAIFLAGAGAMLVFSRRRPASAAAASAVLTQAENEEIARLFQDRDMKD